MIWKIKKPIILWAVTCCLLLTLALVYFIPKYESKNSIRSKLQTLSPQEKEYLTNFFKINVFTSAFGYTIFADKPMSFQTVNMISEPRSVEGFDYMALGHIYDFYRMREGWEVWLKYSSLFPLSGFSIIYYPFPLAPSESIEVAIINHKYFINTVDEHLLDFQTVLGEKLTPQQILDEYLKGSGTIFTRIRNHEGLFGTLLGFGRDNAWEYLKRSGGETMDAFWDGWPLDTQHILPPLFKAIGDSQETYKLRVRYDKERPQIDPIFQSEDFLEIVLSQLTGQNHIDLSQ